MEKMCRDNRNHNNQYFCKVCLVFILGSEYADCKQSKHDTTTLIKMFTNNGEKLKDFGLE